MAKKKPKVDRKWTFSFFLGSAPRNLINKYAKETKVSKAEVVRQALQEFFQMREVK